MNQDRQRRVSRVNREKNRQDVSEMFDIMIIIRPLRKNKHDYRDGVKIKKIMFRQMLVASDIPPIIQHDKDGQSEQQRAKIESAKSDKRVVQDDAVENINDDIQKSVEFLLRHK